MCRFAAYLGQPMRLDELLLRPDHSIVRQSYAAEEARETMNGDGFGVGWYVRDLDPGPALYRNVRPAWADTNMAHIAPRTRTNLFFAHVRGATPGIPIHQLNCHPFVSGRLMFMHNGSIGSHEAVIQALREDLDEDLYFSIQGSTDSEHVFAVVRQLLGDEAEDPSPEQLGQALVGAIGHIEEVRRSVDGTHPTVANLALTDGRSIVALRYASEGETPASLYMGRARAFECRDGVTVAHGQGERGSVLLSSEALWKGSTDWERVPENHLVTVDPTLGVTMEDIGQL